MQTLEQFLRAIHIRDFIALSVYPDYNAKVGLADYFVVLRVSDLIFA